MAVRLSAPWRPFEAAEVAGLAGHLGVYELADAAGRVVYIGVAGGRSRFGLRGELEQRLAAPPAAATQFRIEVNMAYSTRHLELLEVHVHDHGALPVANTDVDPAALGRLMPG